ncbi:hypothetical protein D3C83_252950 [compost metagenome]
MTATASIGDSSSIAAAAPRSASCIFVTPPASACIEPDRSSAIAIARPKRRCSSRISIVTGSTSSTAER